MWDTRLNYQLLGDNSQVLEINIEPNKTLIADGAALLYADEEIIFELKDDDGTNNTINQNQNNYYQEDNEEEEIAFPNFDNPNWEDDETPKRNKTSTKTNDDEEQNQGLLEKFWGATKKNFGKIFKPKNKENQEQEENQQQHSNHLDNIFNRDTPKKTTHFEDNFEDSPKNYQSENNEAIQDNNFSWYITHCINESEYIRSLAFTAGSQGRFVAIDLNEPYENTIIIQNGSFVCGRKGIKINTFVDTSILISKENEKYLKLDSIIGNDYVFLKAGGFVIVKDLENDGIRLNANALLAYESSLEFIWEDAEKITAMNTDTENFLITLSGTGRFWLQTNYPKLTYEAISPLIPIKTTSKTEKNSGLDDAEIDYLSRENIENEDDKAKEYNDSKDDLDLPNF
ncbi:MAG: AIM24 family protein [Cytophagia bacterium]|nr:MAG: AIM24 family protein [Cytophagia bacterium]